ncbi:MAG: SDR family oxidoreductase [Desulfobacterales bacterium]|nr:MAG: SDR family oxidoreductase [Desulfobacterales bacterium]
MKLEGKSAVITGGAMGIGKAIAKLFAMEGCRVVIADMEEEKGDKTQKEIEKQGGSCLFIPCDVSKAGDVKEMVQKAIAFCSSIHILVNNAAIWRPGRVTDLTEELWDQVIDTNLKSIFLVSREMIPLLQKAGGGSLINIASVAGLVGAKEASAYNASKGGVVNLTRGMALDFAQDRIRVNCICPGLIETAQGDMVVAHYAPDQDPQAAMASWQPMAQIGKPQDVAKAALYFASDDSSFATGSIFVIDGGLTTA